MARVFIDSFETQSLSLWDVNSGCTIVAASALDMKGDYCLDCTGSADHIYKEVPENNEYYFACRWRPSSTSSGNLLQVYHNSTLLLNLRVISGSLLRVYRGTTSIVIGSKVYSTSITYFMQIYLKIANTGGRVWIKYNGYTDINFTGDTQVGTDTTISKARFGNYGYYDNIVVDNSIMPERTEIVVLRPNGVGAVTEWNPSAGDNYDCVDEIPHSDLDYNYIDTIDKVDTYNLENLPGEAKSIKCVQAQIRAKRDGDSIPTKANIVLRASGANYHGDDISLITTWANGNSIWAVNPADSQDFERGDIDNLEMGIRSRS